MTLRWRCLRLAMVGLFLTTLPLSGALYRSNSLGQSLEQIEERDREAYRYVLQVTDIAEGHEQKLLQDNGNLILQVDLKTDSDGTTQVTEQYFASLGEPGRIVETLYEEGLPRQVRITEDGKTRLSLHSYVDGHLIEVKELLDGELLYLITYYRGSDGMLSGLRIIGDAQAFTQGFHSMVEGIPVYGESTDDMFTRLEFHPDNLVIQDVWIGDVPQVETTVERDEIERLVVLEKREGTLSRKTYGPDGMLTSEEQTFPDGSSIHISYQYDANGVLDQSIEIQEGEDVKRIERWYLDGEVQTWTEWINDIPVRSTRYLADRTSVVTLFEEGRPYADVTYAPDGKRVLSLEYRMER